ncbi:MAG: formylglycine-generating enzyme family protein [Planctomycetes bacterium]|nr:formylglycine-generating enzyme family protein [Planctomycetota bacterium]
MWGKDPYILITFAVITISGHFATAACPSADVTGNCFVDFEDFAVMANQWLSGDANIPDDMAYIPHGGFAMGDLFGEGSLSEVPVHAVLLGGIFMSKYETTNRQYCDYLNEANSSGQIKVVSGIVYASSDAGDSYPYCDTSIYDTDSQIDYSGGVFSVRTKGGRDMSDDPMVEVSWYGAAAYCNRRSSREGKELCYNLSTWECDFSKHGYRLPTEAEWEYAARGGEQYPYYRFSRGDTISHSQANYYSYWEGGSPYYPYDVNPTEGFHSAYNDANFPYTAPVGSFSANGYGLYDMTGNVFEYCNDWYDSNYYSTSPYYNPLGPVSGSFCIVRGGSWDSLAEYCRVAYRNLSNRNSRFYDSGFRVVLSD